MHFSRYIFPRRYSDASVTAHTSIIPIWIPGDVTQNLQKLAKEAKVTLNGVITAVAALAMARLIWQKKQVLCKLKNESHNCKADTPTFPIEQPADHYCLSARNFGGPETFTPNDLVVENSPFVAINPRDKDSFPLPVHTPAHIAGKKYKPWSAAVGGYVREADEAEDNVARQRRTAKPWRVPLHLNSMQAISCRRWLKTYDEAVARRDTDQYIDFLRAFLLDAVKNGENGLPKPIRQTDSPRLPEAGRYDSDTTAESAVSISNDASDGSLLSDPRTPVPAPPKFSSQAMLNCQDGIRRQA